MDRFKIPAVRRADRALIKARTTAEFAHELGTPLNVVAGRLELLDDVPELDQAKDAVKRLIDVVQRRLEKDTQSAEPVDVDLTPILKELCAEPDRAAWVRWTDTRAWQVLSAWAAQQGDSETLTVEQQTPERVPAGFDDGPYLRVRFTGVQDDDSTLHDLTRESLHGFNGWYVLDAGTLEIFIQAAHPAE